MPTDQTASLSRASSLLLGVVFLLSGAVALIYEAAWQRQFTLLFGSAAPATAVVLAAFFTGLGMGNWLLGKYSARWRQPLRVYAILELFIAGGALLVAPVLSLYASFYPDLFARMSGGGAGFLAVKGLLAFLAIVIPTMAMGGTLPVLAQLFNSRRDHLGEMAGWLYMLNTAGAALGVLCFPALLGSLGMRQSVWLCAGLNLVIAAGAFVLAKSASVQIQPVSDEKPAAPNAKRRKKSRSTEEGVTPRGPLRNWLALTFLSGFVTFVLQIGWSRIFAQTHENSVWSFSIIVAIFIAAIAAGAQLARVLLRRKWPPGAALGRAWLAGGFLTMLCPLIFLRLSGGLQYAADGGSAFSIYQIGPAVVVIFVPVVFLAVGLPLILQQVAAVSARATGELTGTVFAWNVAGSVTGALAAGFILPGLLGMWGIIVLAAAIVILCGGMLLGKRVLRHLAWVGALLITAGMFIHLPRTHLATNQGEKLLAIKEGAYGVVAVVERPGSRRLKLNNHYSLGGSASVGDERMQAQIPLMLHPDPQQVAFLGYGTGISAGGASFSAPRQVTALELVPEAAALAGEFFADENNHFSSKPQESLIIEDARNFLRGTPQRFDVIIGDLVVPWRQGEGALYTLEHFTAAHARLSPRGLYCAWLPLFQLGEEDLHSILHTFLEVFPGASLWRGDFSPHEPALALIGSTEGAFDPNSVVLRLGKLQPDPMNPQLKHPAAFWMHFVGMMDKSAACSGPLNTEDRPIVELRTNRPPPFTGRAFQTWAGQIRHSSGDAVKSLLPTDAYAGWEAGQLMGEFTLALFEGRRADAEALQKKIVEILGAEVARSIFGG